MGFRFCREFECNYKKDHKGQHQFQNDDMMVEMLDQEEKNMLERIAKGATGPMPGHKMHTAGYNTGVMEGWKHARKFLNLEGKDV